MQNLCHYGCNQQAQYTFKNGIHCCEKSFKKCPINRKKTGDKTISDWKNPSRLDKFKASITEYYEHRTEEERLQKSKKCSDAVQSHWDNKTVEERELFSAMRSEIQKQIVFSEEELELMSAKKKATWAEKSKTEIDDRNQKMIRTNIERYGVEYNSQVAEISEKQHSYKFKEFVFPSGRIDKVQGYEPQVLSMLLSEGINEDDIITARGEVPAIWYYLDGKKARYFPDIYIKSQNKIVEVKSTWTWEQYKSKNMAKLARCREMGFNVELYVLDEKEKRVHK